MRFGGIRTAIAALIAALCFATAAGAASVRITDVSADFLNPTWHVEYPSFQRLPGSAGDGFVRNVPGSNAIWWGDSSDIANPARTSYQQMRAPSGQSPWLGRDELQQSGLKLEQYATGDQTGDFQLAKFTHFNGDIWNYSALLGTVTMRVSISGYIGSHFFTLAKDFGLTHFETPNRPVSGVCRFGGLPPCSDIVRFTSGSIDTTEAVTIGGTVYTLTVSGMVNSWGTAIPSLWTPENEMRHAYIRGSLASDPITTSVVPLPAGIWLLLAGIGVLGALRRGQRATD